MKSPVWYGELKDAQGVRKRVLLGTNKAAAELQLSALVKKVEQERAGLRDAYSDHRAATLSALLDEFGRFHADKGISDKQVKQVRQRCEVTFAGVRAMLLRDLMATAEAYLGWSRQHLSDDTHRVNLYYCQLFAEYCGRVTARELKLFHVTHLAGHHDVVRAGGPGRRTKEGGHRGR